MWKPVLAFSLFTASLIGADTLDFERPVYRAGKKLDGQDGWDFNPNGKYSRSGDFRIQRNHGHHGNQFLRAHTHGYTQYSREVESQSDTAVLRWRWKAPSGKARLCFGPSDSLEPGKSNWNAFRVKVCFNDADFERHPPHGHHARCGKRHEDDHDGHRHGESRGGEWIYMRLSMDIAAGRYSLYRDEGETRDDEDTLVSNGSINGSGPVSRIFLKAGGRSPYVDVDDIEWGGVGEPPPPPLVLTITSPAQDTLVNQTPISVAYAVNGIPFLRQVALVEGPNRVIIDTVDAFGRRAADTVNITLDTQPPLVQITSPATGIITNQPTIPVAWTLDGIVQTVQITENLTQEGTNTITRSTMDAAGNIGSVSIQVIRDTEAPAVVITSPSDEFMTNQTLVAVSWSVDGMEQTAQTTETLGNEGANIITRSFTDAAGNTGTVSITVIRDTQAPVVAITSPADRFTTDRAEIAVTWTVDGVVQTTQTTENLEVGQNSIVRSATDAAGNTESASIQVTRTQVQPPGHVVVIISPLDGFLTSERNISVSWTVDGAAQPVSDESLVEGINFITRSFMDSTGQTRSATIRVFRISFPDNNIRAYAGVTPSNGGVPLTVTFTGWGNSYAGIRWHKLDFDGDGIFDTAISVPPDTLLIRQYDFEAGLQGWIPGGTSGVLSLAHGGERTNGTLPKVWSSNISQYYSDMADSWILSPGITLPAGVSSFLSFRQTFSSEYCCDFGFVQVDDGSGSFTNLHVYNGDLGGVTDESIDLSAFAGTIIRLRFQFISDFSGTSTGWQIGNIQVRSLDNGNEQILFSDSADGAVAWEKNPSGVQWGIINDPNGPALGKESQWIESDTATYTYKNGMDAFITSPKIGLPDSGGAGFSFWQYLITPDFGDGAVVEISADDGIFTRINPVGEYPGIIDGHGPGFTGYMEASTPYFDLSSYAGDSVRIRFRFFSNDSGTDRGWLIDSVRVYHLTGGLGNGISEVSHTYTVPGNNQAFFYVEDNAAREAQADPFTTAVQVGIAGSPAVSIISPINGFVTNQTEIPVVWSVDGVIQTHQSTESLAFEGVNVVTRTYTDSAGRTSSASVRVNLDTQPPFMFIYSPNDGLVTNQRQVQVYWYSDVSGYVFYDQDLLEGENFIVVNDTDEAGNISSATLRVFLDTQPPVVLIVYPERDTTIAVSSILVQYTVDGEPFSQFFRLILGQNEIIVHGQDAVGNVGADTVHVSFENERPIWPDGSTLIASNVKTTSLSLSWSEAADDDGIANYIVYRHGALIATLSSTQRTYNVVGLLMDSVYDFRVEAKDSQGVASNTGPRASATTGNSLPPDPVMVATPVENGVATNMADAVSFLYQGPDALQTGVTDSALNPVTIAVLRGSVRDVVGNPVTGVSVSALNHPEIGSTLTRSDGNFDLAVNGGGYMVVSFSAKNYLPVQRNVRPLWQEFEVMDTVVMTRLDTVVNEISFAGIQPLQVARASLVSDSDGTRQATLLVPTGTSANMVMPDGRLQALSSMHVRATEFTVGPNGPRAMPGDLPPTSFYTYAVEFTSDEALSQGAVEVKFSTPVWCYLENFINIPVGYSVPAAFYDREKGQWVPMDDGRVIGITSITDGKADIVVGRYGALASQEALDFLGITEEERTKLADLYSPGQSLWRVGLTHFSSIDFNLPGGPPDGSTAPEVPPPEKDKKENKCDTQNGSVIECQNQILGESVVFPGISGMHYRSDRVHTKRWNTIKIRASGASVPDFLEAITLEISVGGRITQYLLPPLPNLVIPFSWDGMDVYGRYLHGKQPFSYTLGYGYPTSYSPPPSNPPLCGQSGNLDFGNCRTFGATGSESFPQQVTARQLMYMTSTYSGLFGNMEINDLGQGWSLEGHHFYDPASKTLRQGDGQDRGADNLVGAAYTVAGSVSGTDQDGIPATRATLGLVNEIDLGSDGSIYIAEIRERGTERLRRVDPNGIITTLTYGKRWYDVEASSPDGSIYLTQEEEHLIWKLSSTGELSIFAGTGEAGFSGDGGLATNAKLNGPNNAVIGLDGSLYIADRSNNRVRKVTPDGIIQTVAGTGTRFYFGEGTPATESGVAPNHIAMAADGTLYIADAQNGRIRKIDRSGLIWTVAGNGTNANTGNGIPAVNAGIVSNRIEVANTKEGGTLIYLTDLSESSPNRALRVIDENGVINLLAGSGTTRDENGIPAPVSNITDPRGLAVDAAGNVYIGVFSSLGLVRKIYGGYPAFSKNQIQIPSEDGGEIYQFSPIGRHLKTFNAYTGKELLSFSYHTSGFLSRVTDALGNVTEIVRTTDGQPTELRNPYGKILYLDVDPAGNLNRVTLPSNETHDFTYSNGSLLATYTTPRRQVHTFSYDGDGRLLKDEDPAGGFKALESEKTANGGWSASVTSAMGRRSLYEMVFTNDLQTVKQNTDPSGFLTTTVNLPSGVIATDFSDGTKTSTAMGPESQLSLPGMWPTSIQTALPSGLTKSQNISQETVLGDRSNPLSLVSRNDTAVINGRTFTTTYDNSLRQWISVSPQGRVTTTRIDSLGKVLERIIPGIENAAYSYDSRGRLATITQGSGIDARSTVFAYNPSGYLSSIQDAENRTFVFEYDLAGRVTKETLPDGREINYTYDADGNVSSITPPSRPAHEFEYTPVDLEARYNPPSLGAGTFDTRYAYNLDRQLLDIDRPDAVQVHYNYDTGGRVSSIATPNGDFTFAYHPTTGKLDNIASPYGVTTAYAYDGILPTSTTWTGTVGGSVSVGYNNNFWVTSQSVNGSNAVSFSYDNDGLLTQAGTLALSRDPQNGRLAGSSTGVVSDALTYSAFGEVEEYNASISGTPAYRCVYERDKLGRITKKTETVESTTTIFEYEYDLAGRLKQVKQDALVTAVYAYDANGNRLSKTDGGGVTSGTYDAQDRLTQYGSAFYSYNANGDLESKTEAGQTTTYAYDAFGNLITVSLPDGMQIEYVIDGQNRRVGKKVNGVLVQGFLYQNQLNPVAELDGAGNVVARFVYGTKSNVPDLMTKVGVTYRIISDHLGSPRLVVKVDDGTVVQRLVYDEFGNVIEDSNPGLQPFGFAGGLYDLDTRLERFGARDYETGAGRWTAKDPIGFGGGDNNLYGYSLGDPINFVDQNGYYSIPVFIGVAATALVIAYKLYQKYKLGGEKFEKFKKTIEARKKAMDKCRKYAEDPTEETYEDRAKAVQELLEESSELTQEMLEEYFQIVPKQYSR